MDEELSYQNVEDFADIEAPIRESLSEHQFEVKIFSITLKPMMLFQQLLIDEPTVA